MYYIADFAFYSPGAEVSQERRRRGSRVSSKQAMPGTNVDVLMLGLLLFDVAHQYAAKDNFTVATPVMYAATGLFFASIALTIRIVLLP